VFNYTSPYLASASAIMGGALHATELPFVFGEGAGINGSSAQPSTLAPFTYAADNATSNTMRAYWIKFIETGDVNSATTSLPGIYGPTPSISWEELSVSTTDSLLFQADGSLAMVQNVYKTECDLWDPLAAKREAFPIVLVGPITGPSSSTGSQGGSGAIHAPSSLVVGGLAIAAVLAAWVKEL
jgi:hypothetical protein